MSLSREVPAAVPSDFHSSRPRTPSSAVKNTVPPTDTMSDGPLEGACGSHVAAAPRAPEPCGALDTWVWTAAAAGETAPERLLPARPTATTAAARTAGLEPPPRA